MSTSARTHLGHHFGPAPTNEELGISMVTNKVAVAPVTPTVRETLGRYLQLPTVRQLDLLTRFGLWRVADPWPESPEDHGKLLRLAKDRQIIQYLSQEIESEWEKYQESLK